MKVIIIGAGIAGPVLALLLKHKGFSPVLYEAGTGVDRGGVSVQLSPQTFKVLNIVGLAERALELSQEIEMLEFRSQTMGRTLFAWDVPRQIKQEAGWPMCHCPRPLYVKMLIDACKERGIPVHFRKRLVGVEQDEWRARASFEDGSWDEGELLVGCDGLRSAVRDQVFDQSKPYYQGVVVIGGVAPRTPLYPIPTLLQVFGDGAHFLAVPMSSREIMFQCLVPEPRPSLDQWRPVPLTTTQGRAMLGALPQARWPGAPARVLATATKAYRHAALLRKPLERWNKGRVVLCGDAANAATPHLGQGANQAAEDAYHLVRLLSSPAHLPLTLEELDTALSSYTALRLPHAAKVLASSLAEGKMRILLGAEKCKKRDEALSQSLTEGRWREFMERMKGPFEGESEI